MTGSVTEQTAIRPVQRKSVFGERADYTISLLHIAFRDVGAGADHERCSEDTARTWCKLLDKCVVDCKDAAATTDTEAYVEKLVQICDTITSECTGHPLLGVWCAYINREVATAALTAAWQHFMRVLTQSDPEWKELIAAGTLRHETARIAQGAPEVQVEAEINYQISGKLLAPLQVWNAILKEAVRAAPLRMKRL